MTSSYIKTLLEEIKKDPTRQEELIEECTDKIYKLFQNKSKNYILVDILTNLYDGDYEKTRAELIKVIFMEKSGDLKNTSLERAIFIKIFTHGRFKSKEEDFSTILDELDRVIECKKDTNLPFV